ncbi:NUMOD3 domain-containing DNA-binding protein [bacterium]|nr:NUMOD3 domain-containing DNA-binding protein [bacterium]
MKNLYHYVYRITNIKINKHYYGVRTSKQEPYKDLGIKYFSSSTDKEFKSDQKTNPQDYKYKVVSIRDTREESVGLEIRLHAKFNVDINESFYNKVKQTSRGFDATGIPKSPAHKKQLSDCQIGRIFSEEHRMKISKAQQGRVLSEEHRMKLSKVQQGRVFSEEHLKKLSKAQRGIPKVKANHPCKWCGKSDISQIGMTRYHNDNCKQNPARHKQHKSSKS